MKDLTEFLDKYGVKYTIDGDTVKVGGNLYLDNNQLTSLPESFGNLKVGGDLYLYYNQLTILPESFGNLKVGGNLSLDNNQLKDTPNTPRMTPTVERDWCFIDGIVREIVSKKRVGELTIIKTPFDFIVGNGEVWAHGKTIKDATEDYQFKLVSVDPESIKDIDLDKPMTHAEAINVYRAVTRSCREGVRQWMSGKTFPEPITVRQIVGMTGDAYGGSEFAKFFEVQK